MRSQLNEPYSLEVAELLWTLGLLKENELPSVGVEALVKGYDSSALRVLAGLGAHENAARWFELSLQELGRAKLTKLQAARQYAKIVAKDISDGGTAPYDGARAIWHASLQLGDEMTHEFDEFVYAASEYESRPYDRKHFASEIRKIALNWPPENH